MTSSSEVNHSGITQQDDERIGWDIACWSCEYNLRTLSRDANCPECGTPVQTTIEHRLGQKSRPFSLYTLHPISRTLGLIYGCFGPALIVIVAALEPMNPINVEWQSGEVEDYIGVMLSGRAMWAFYPFLIWSYVAYTALMIRPIVLGGKWWIRIGLWLGCILGVQYQLIIVGNLVGLSEGAFIAVVLGLVPIGVIAVVIWIFCRNDATRRRRPLENRSARYIAGYVFGTLGGLIVVGLLSRGLVFLPVLFAGPYLMLMCMGTALCRLYRTNFDPPRAKNKPIPLAATGAGYLAAWPLAISQAQIVYSSLPMSPPGCYVCTASARGHHWLTRAKPVRFPDGTLMLVTKQMQTLKTAEYAIQKKLPSLHKWIRSVYDRLGPHIARRIRSPWIADLSFVLFALIAFAAWMALRITGQSRNISKAYLGEPFIQTRSN